MKQVFSDLGKNVSCSFSSNFTAAGNANFLSIDKVDGPLVSYTCSGSAITESDPLTEEEGIACINDIGALCNPLVSTP